MAGALLDLFEFLKRYSLEKCKGQKDVKNGDVVACFDTTTKKCLGIGTVKHVGRTKLSDDHPDGEFGDVFVLSYEKGRSKKDTPLNQQDGWWMFEEVAVLPKQGENFSKSVIARNVMYVGHKATTRQEQTQQNWSIEVQTLQIQDITQDNSDTDITEKKKKAAQKKKRKRKRTPSSKKIKKQIKKGTQTTKSPPKPAASKSKTPTTPLRRSPRKTGEY